MRASLAWHSHRIVDALERKVTMLSSFPHDLGTHMDAQRHADADADANTENHAERVKLRTCWKIDVDTF